MFVSNIRRRGTACRPRGRKKIWPDIATFYQHLGADLPTPNINLLGERFQHFHRALIGRSQFLLECNAVALIA